MMKKVSIFLLVIMVLSMVLASCTPTVEPEEPEVEEPEPTEELAVGIVLPTKDEPRWIQDQTRFQDKLAELGYDVEILFSQADPSQEKANVETLITKGAKVIILCPHDSAAAAASAEAARAAGVTIVSYDRLITDTEAVDYYVTFDSVSVGMAQAQYLVDKAEGEANPLYLYAGAATDNNAFLFFEGAWKVLQPKVADGTFYIVNSEKAVELQDKAELTRDEMGEIIGQITTNWDFDDAKSLAEANLTAAAAEDKGDVFILAPNDGTARAIADAFGADTDVSSYVVTGQDAEIASVQYIIDGKQSMTVLKDVRYLVDDAITLAVSVVEGATVETTGEYDNGVTMVPAKQSGVITVDQSNVVETIIDSGYWPASEFTGLEDLAAPEEEEEALASIRIWADEQRAPVLSELAEDFKAEYGVELVVENISGIRDQFLVAAPAGEGPDIVVLAHDQSAALIASGLAAEVDLGDKAGDFHEEAKEAFTFGGVLYGMPYATENLGFFYNTDYVETVPTTWQEVYDQSAQLIADGTVEFGMVLAGTSYDAYPWMTSQGGYIFGQDENGDYNPQDVGVGSEGMIAFGEMAKQWADDGILSDNTDNATAKAMFLNGEVAFFMNGPWELTNLREGGTPYAIAAFPDGGEPFMGVQGFMINAFSENVLLANAFLTEFVATEATMLKFYEVDPRVPAYTPALEKMDDADLIKIAEAGANAQPMPAIPEMGKVWGDWGNALTFILNGEKTPEEAYTFAQEAIEAAIAADTEGMVNVPGSWQSTVSDCEWDPKCEATALTLGDDGLYSGTFTIPAGDYEVKVALDGGWDTNSGVDGVAGGDNYLFTVEADGDVTFTFDPETNLLEITLP